MQTPEPNMKKVPSAPSMPTAAKTALWSVLILLSALILCHVTVLKITTVTVVGNENVSRADILALAGLNRPVSILNIREKDVQAGIDSHVRLTYEKMEYEGLNRLVLYVKERLPVANLIAHDGAYVLDGEGMVLEKGDGALDNGLIALTGMNVKRAVVGEVIMPVDAKQLQAYVAVMGEILLQRCQDTFTELNVTKADQLYLMSQDLYAIDLGDMTEMRAKLLTVRGVLEEVRKLGYEVGALDASTPGYAIYTPPEL